MRRYLGALAALVVVGGLLYFGLGFFQQHSAASALGTGTGKIVTWGPPALGRHGKKVTKCGPPGTSSGHLGAVLPRPLMTHLPEFTRYVSQKKLSITNRPSVVEYYENFGNPLNLSQARYIYTQHAFPILQWDPYNIPPNSKSSLLEKIVHGSYNSYLQRTARAVSHFKCRIALSFGHEMNGNWYQWGYTHVSPALFIAAYRHIHDVFAKAGVHNVIWAWTVIRQDIGESPLQKWYPGKQYVDWIGVDGYYRRARTTFSEFNLTFRTLRRYQPTPVFFAETAVSPRARQAAQIRNLFYGAAKHHVFALIWFDIPAKQQWQLNVATKAALAALPRAVRKYVNASWPT